MRSNAEARGSRREMRVGFQSRKDKTACSCRLSPRSPRPRDVISTKKSVQNYKTGFLRRSTAVSSQGARAGERGRVRLAGTASPHLCPADARQDLKTGFCLRSPPRRMTDYLRCASTESPPIEGSGVRGRDEHRLVMSPDFWILNSGGEATKLTRTPGWHRVGTRFCAVRGHRPALNRREKARGNSGLFHRRRRLRPRSFCDSHQPLATSG